MRLFSRRQNPDLAPSTATPIQAFWHWWGRGGAAQMATATGA